MLELAKEVVEAEKNTDPAEERDRAKEPLTEVFNEAKSKNTLTSSSSGSSPTSTTS
jgi:type I restriction enzyme, R subunit